MVVLGVRAPGVNAGRCEEYRVLEGVRLLLLGVLQDRLLRLGVLQDRLLRLGVLHDRLRLLGLLHDRGRLLLRLLHDGSRLLGLLHDRSRLLGRSGLGNGADGGGVLVLLEEHGAERRPGSARRKGGRAALVVSDLESERGDRVGVTRAVDVVGVVEAVAVVRLAVLALLGRVVVVLVVVVVVVEDAVRRRRGRAADTGRLLSRRRSAHARGQVHAVLLLLLGVLLDGRRSVDGADARADRHAGHRGRRVGATATASAARGATDRGVGATADLAPELLRSRRDDVSEIDGRLPKQSARYSLGQIFARACT